MRSMTAKIESYLCKYCVGISNALSATDIAGAIREDAQLVNNSLQAMMRRQKRPVKRCYGHTGIQGQRFVYYV